MNITFEIKLIEGLIDIIQGGVLDYNYLDLKEWKDIIQHDHILGRKTEIEDIEKALKNTINNINVDEQCYYFNKVKNRVEDFKNVLAYFKYNEDTLKNNVLKRMERYIPLEVLDDCTFYLYVGLYDFGFALKEKEVYINIGKMIDYMIDIEDLIVHELYHARIKFIKKEDMKESVTKDKYLKFILSGMAEEGIATLIEFEYEKKKEESQLLTKEIFNKKYEYMKGLEKYINDVTLGLKTSDDALSELKHSCWYSVYVVGYWMAQVIYKHAGRNALNIWTLDGDINSYIKIFFEFLRKDNIASGLSKETEDFIINYCSVGV